jgi:ABC-2 type transport system ATP-binding protein
MIEVRNLTKKYGDFVAVDNISFEARPGEILGFLGPNGAGKTTTMRVLTGYMPPTSGTVSVAGLDIFEDALEARRHIGYLPERVPLYPDMTVRGSVSFVAELQQVPHRRQRVDAVLERVGMAGRADSLIRNISKGMRQRVGLAQALVHNPDVLILDEPTIGLDPHQVIDLRKLVRELGADRTVMFSTHILSEAEQVCDRVLIIEKGRLVAEGAPDKLRDELGRGGRVYLRLGGRPPEERQVVKTLKDLGGVVEVQSEGDGYLIEMAKGVDVRADLADLAVHAGWRVIELRPWAMTLEDLFLEITTAQIGGPVSGRPADKQEGRRR